MLFVQNECEVNALAWDRFVVENSSTPYSQTTMHGQYSKSCYGHTPLYVHIDLEKAKLRCLVLFSEAQNTVKWANGPVTWGSADLISDLVELFLGWLCDLKVRVRNAACLELNSVRSISVCNELLVNAARYRIEPSMAIMVKKSLTQDIWENATYRSGGKKRKTRHIVTRAGKDGISICAGIEEYTGDHERLYLDHYRSLIEQGYERNQVTNQDALGACRLLMMQDQQNSSKTFFAFKQDELMACLNFATVGSEAYLRKLAHNTASSGATYMAMMSAAQWAQTRGLTTLNLTNVRLGMDEKVRNIRQYKTRFGGEVIPIYEFSSISYD